MRQDRTGRLADRRSKPLCRRLPAPAGYVLPDVCGRRFWELLALNETKPVGRSPAPRPEDFPHRTVQTVRFSDLDRHDHVNNAVFATFFEAGRVVILYNEEYGLTTPGASFVLAHLSIDFLGEIRWPGEVEIGTAIAAVGNSSLKVRQALFVNGACVATAENTLVRVDEETHRPFPFTPEHALRIRASAARGAGDGASDGLASSSA
jgi:acyl-CoA thioester hydrolase